MAIGTAAATEDALEASTRTEHASPGMRDKNFLFSSRIRIALALSLRLFQETAAQSRLQAKGG